MANGQNRLIRALLDFLAWSARHGSALLAGGIVLGLLVPPLARAFGWFITPNVVALMTMVLLRVDVVALLSHLRRPGRLAAVLAFQLVISPLLMALLLRPFALDPGIVAGAIVISTGASSASGAAFARLVGLDPELTLLVTLGSIVLVPLTGPPLAYALSGVDLQLGVGTFMLRLALVVGVPMLASIFLRLWAGPRRLHPLGPAIDGGVVWLVVFYGFAVMDGLLGRMLAEPVWVAQALLIGLLANFGLNVIATLCFWWMGAKPAASAGMMVGNRNMALYLAVLPASANPQVRLFLALAQLPLFFSPFLLRPVYRWLLRRRL